MEPEPMEGEDFEQQIKGITAAPNLPAKRGPGRPKKVVEEIVEAKPAEGEAPAESEEQASAFAEPQDSELDSMMNQVLGSKIGKMMS